VPADLPLGPVETVAHRAGVEIVAALREDLDELRREGTGRGLVCRSEVGGFVHLGNWRKRVWKPACAAAGIEANPYDGRHSYASLLIHEGRSPLAVAAAMGHSSAETTWKHYVHLFEGVRDGERVPIEEAIARARVRPVCVEGPRRHLRLVS
jgi:integrase